MLRKLLTIIVIILFIAGQFGIYYVYCNQQAVLRKEMKERILAGLPDSVLNIIDAGLVNRETEFEENRNEFSLGGKMYDIVKTTTQNGKVYYHCINDEKEEKLLNDFANIENDLSKNKPAGKPLRYLVKFKITDLNISEQENRPVFYTVSAHQWHPARKGMLTQGIVRFQTPPPRLFTT